MQVCNEPQTPILTVPKLSTSASVKSTRPQDHKSTSPSNLQVTSDRLLKPASLQTCNAALSLGHDAFVLFCSLAHRCLPAECLLARSCVLVLRPTPEANRTRCKCLCAWYLERQCMAIRKQALNFGVQAMKKSLWRVSKQETCSRCVSGPKMLSVSFGRRS